MVSIKIIIIILPILQALFLNSGSLSLLVTNQIFDGDSKEEVHDVACHFHRDPPRPTTAASLYRQICAVSVHDNQVQALHFSG